MSRWLLFHTRISRIYWNKKDIGSLAHSCRFFNLRSWNHIRPSFTEKSKSCNHKATIKYNITLKYNSKSFPISEVKNCDTIMMYTIVYKLTSASQKSLHKTIHKYIVINHDANILLVIICKYIIFRFLS